MMDKRLSELESRLAFQDDAIIALNETVARQNRELAEIRIVLQQLAQALQEIPQADSGNQVQEIPPHY